MISAGCGEDIYLKITDEVQVRSLSGTFQAIIVIGIIGGNDVTGEAAVTSSSGSRRVICRGGDDEQE
jgi:hypothetical protein